MQNMQTIEEATRELESKLAPLREIMSRIEELMKDIKTCNGDTTKAIILSAVKNYAGQIHEYKV